MKNRVYIFIMVLFFAVVVNASGEATLKNIKVNGISCVCTGYDCVVDVNASSATITYDLDDTSAKVDRLSGFKIDLLSQITTIKLTVTNSTNEDVIENVYNITINKQEVENDLSLKSLKVNGQAMNVAEDIVVYSFECEYDTKVITLEVVPNDSTVTVVKQESYEFPLEDRSLSVDFSLKPISGEQLDYRVVATRNMKPDTSLKSLKINDKEIKLVENELEYELTVEYNVNELKIDAITNNKDAKVSFEEKTLVVGENEIKIKVINDKTESEYVLHVTREENIDKSVANLKELVIDEYQKLDFKENVLDYTLKFNNIPEKLTIHAKAKNDDGEIEILNNEELVDGSNIIVKVKVNNIVREYNLIIKESNDISDNKSIILICIIVLSITILILLFLEIHNKKQEKKKYLKKVFELRHKIERKRKEDKEKKKKIKVKTKEKKVEEEIEII